MERREKKPDDCSTSSPSVAALTRVLSCLTVACAPSDAAERGYFAKRAQEMIQKGLESFGSTCPAGVSVRFASLVGLRYSYQFAQTTGPYFVLRSHWVVGEEDRT